MRTVELGWYARRLRRMSVSEVTHRALDQSRRRVWARRQVRPGDVATAVPVTARERSFRGLVPAGVRDAAEPTVCAAVVAAAERVLDGTWSVFGVERFDSADPDWFLDPSTGRRAPEQDFCFSINHRREHEVGNVKQIWELSRHHHLTVLATAWWVTRDDRYARAVAAQLRSWWRANPFLSGIHWTSGIEVGVRLMSWTWIRRLLDDWVEVQDLFERDPDALRQIHWHQEYLAAFPSHGSSANNHVIAEAAGLLVSACAFPWYESSVSWREKATQLFERELRANTFPSGLNRELATDYHRFVLELALVTAVEADAQGFPLSSETWECIARMADAGVAMLDVAGRAPRQGDGDEGRGLVVDDPDLDPWAVALGAAGSVVDAADWWPSGAPSLQGSLLGSLARARSIGRPTERPTSFDDAGMTLLRGRLADGAEVWCRCDGGPHGFLSIAAHAHADALSVEVRLDGVELLVDPGTYCYHGEPQWRQWFRSTAAHNTLEVAGENQSESGGPFLWVSHAHAETSERGTDPSGGRQTWRARHTGYLRLAGSIVHHREVTLATDDRLLTVTDTLEATAQAPIRLSWHLGPDVSVELVDACAQLSWTVHGQLRRATLSLPEGLSWRLHRGEESPISGWYSPGFGVRVPTNSLVGSGTGIADAELVTHLRFD